MSAGEAGARCALREGLRVLQEQHRVWRAALASCAPLVDSLAGLADQAEAARKVSLGDTPLRGFPRLGERLRLKQRGAMEVLLAELQQDKLAELREVRDTVGACLPGLLPQVQSLGQECAFQPSALCPSLADMLAWLLDAEAFYHSVYMEVKLLLLPIRYEDLRGGQALSNAWQHIMQHGCQTTVEDTLLKASFFLEGM